MAHRSPVHEPDISPTALCTASCTLIFNAPAFIGGANNNTDQQAELRIPSLRGMLRFWWRAAHPHLQPAALHAAEAAVFGSVHGDHCRQGVRLIPESVATPRELSFDVTQAVRRDAHLAYTAYGCVNRQAIAPNTPWKLKIRGTRHQVTETLRAFWLLGACGGIGSRNRRGWGSVTLQSVEPPSGFSLPPYGPQVATPEALTSALREGLQQLASTAGNSVDPQHSAFSIDSRIAVWKEAFSSASDAHKEIAYYFHSLREHFGRAPQDRLPEAEGKHDHDLAYDLANGRRVTEGPWRTRFGLPHNYYLRSSKTKIDINASANGCERRASPVWLHIARIAEDQFVPMIVYLPGLFLPSNPRPLTANIGGRRTPLTLPPTTAIDRLFEYVASQTNSVSLHSEG